MSIQLFCQGCKTSSALDTEACPKCEKPFGRNRIYRVQVSVKGNRATRVVHNLTIAREIESALKADLIREEFDVSHHKTKQKTMTVGELWEKHYLPWAKEHKKSWQADSWNYHRHLEALFSFKSLDSISSLDIERMKSALKKATNPNGKPYAAQTVKHQIVLLRRLYNLAAKWGFYKGGNPVQGVQMPRIDNLLTEFFSDEEVSRLLHVLNNWPYDDSAAFIKFALYSGFRRSDIFRLRWDGIDAERGMITVEVKGGRTVTVPVCQEALNVLSGLQQSSDYCFPGKDGGQRTDFRGPWRRIRKAAGLPYRFHAIRHHFASTLVSSGVDLAIVGKLLGHKLVQTTARYAHLKPDAVKAAALKAGGLLTPKKRDNNNVISIA
jgi:integrase